MDFPSHAAVLQTYMRKANARFFIDSDKSYWLCHFAFWFPLAFGTPLFIARHNPDDINYSILALIAVLATSTIICVLVSHSMTRLFSERWYRLLSLFILATAAVFVIQGNIVNDRFYYGEFDGETVNLRSYGWMFWAECGAFFLAIPLSFKLLTVLKRPSPTVPLVLIASCLVLLAPTTVALVPSIPIETHTAIFDEGVFEFSRTRNLIHLLPDGLQGDIVGEVLTEHRDLAERFAGFTVFSNHVGLFQKTAAALPTIYNGRPFDLSLGHDYKKVKKSFNDYAYQNVLHDAGYRMDYVPAGKAYCHDKAATCAIKSINELKPRGYFDYENEGLLYSLRLLADLTLFRHLPMVLKEQIYNQGNWLFSDTTFDGYAPFPDPVIREWTDNISIVDGLPRYKWYHYIGTHTPPQWDEECNFIRGLDHNRENYKQQTYCVLVGIAQFLNVLKQSGIYDQTAIVISGDHGTNAPSNDMIGEVTNNIIYSRGLFAVARPAFLVKELNNNAPLKFSEPPTSLLDIAPTTLDLVGLSGNFEGVSAFNLLPNAKRERVFRSIDIEHFWTGDAIPHDEYRVNGNASDRSSWKLTGFQTIDSAPTEFPNFVYDRAVTYTRGLELSVDETNAQEAWVRGREFAFKISLPEKTFGTLKFRLHIPESMTDQSMSVTINGISIIDSYSIEKTDEHWSEVFLPLDGVTLRKTDNFVSVVFEKSISKSFFGTEVSALLGSVEFY